MSQDTLNIDLEAFQGPFDLLLHLIKSMEVDINDIPIAEVTSQYIQYIHSSESIELDIIGDYLVMAATLIEIKSRLLLPIEPIDGMEDFEFEDPRKNLVQQLLIYQQFQTVSTVLQKFEEQQSKSFSRSKLDLSDFQEVIPLEANECTLEELSHAMLNVIDKYYQQLPKDKEIIQDNISVDEVIKTITTRLQTLKPNEKIYFEELIEKHSRPYIITTFMAVLELVRKKNIVFYQNKIFDPIEIQCRK